MSLARITLAGLVLVVGCLTASPAGALTADQVLKLRQAGVSDETIRMLIENEMAQAGQPGRYVVDAGAGGQRILYQAGSGGTATPLPLTPEQAADPNLGLILGARPSQDLLINQERPEVSQALPLSQGRTVVTHRGYVLLLESHRNLDPAEKRARELNAQGIAAKVESVDLGEKGRWYRVVHGSFPDREAAQAKGEEIKRLGGVDGYTILNP